MITIKPFTALRPEAQHAKAVASRPYDVLNSKEAKIEAQGNPNSFLHVTKAEIDLPETVDVHSAAVYEKAKENLTAFISKGLLFTESKPCYYIYNLTMNGRSQAGLVCASSVNDYKKGLIKIHEYTRPEKEQDRIDHITTTGAQTGNVFLAYRNVPEIDELLTKWMASKDSQYNFTTEDAIGHAIWIVNGDETIAKITELFAAKVPASYIADGHHRAASATKVNEAMGSKATADSHFFLTTLFPSNQLEILDYNRVVKDLNELTNDEFLQKLEDKFTVTASSAAVKPTQPHEIGMYLGAKWYKLHAKEGTWQDDEIGVLDISIFQNNILSPLLGIEDQRTDKRIDFVGGIRGLQALEKAVDGGDMAVAFSFYPVSIEQLFAVADGGKVMPPKSTWFEPKLRDGLLTHLIN
jgi:uncharacterized protein (DUF1015 family)